MKLIDTIPPEILAVVANKMVADVGFGAGPSFCAGKSQTFDPPVSLAEGAEWLERYRKGMRVGHVGFSDETRIYFEPDGFTKYRDKPHEMPSAGIVVSHEPPAGDKKG